MEYLLQMQHICKEFPGVKALSDVNIDIQPGEVHALVGENGAGKSTLMKILNGVYQPDSGTIFVNGREEHILNTHKAQELGISIVYQEFNLCNDISIANNIFMGRLANRFGIVNDKRINDSTGAILQQMGLHLSPERIVGTLSTAEKQMVEIAKAISVQAKIIVFDEPTSSLTQTEIQELFKIIRQLKSQGVGIFYISHRMEELDEIADRVTVLRDGKHIKTFDYAGLRMEDIIQLMVGRELNDKFPVYERKIGEIYFTAENIIRKGTLNVEHLHLRRGEILGIAGLVGAGRTETMRAIFGADPVDEPMRITLNGKPLKIRSPKEAISHGIAYLTEDRKEKGLALTMNIEENISMASHHELSRHGIMDDKKVRGNAEAFVEKLNIKTPGLWQKAQFLSGGNQQKVVLAKWLCRNTKVLIIDEPTRGIDVGGKYEIYKLMNQLSEEGIGIILISSELPEILGMSDRILVFNNGRIAGELSKDEADQVRILKFAVGLKDHEGQGEKIHG